MLSVRRQKLLLDYINAHQSAQITELSDVFAVSLSTVRRDLRDLEANGLVRRVHGGAVLVEDRRESPFEQRAVQQADAKQRIGQQAANLVRDGNTIIMTGGTTAAAMVPHLAQKVDLTIITNAINLACDLVAYPNIAVVVLGGWLRHSESSLLGHLTTQALQDLHADTIFYGTYGIDVDHGLSGMYVQEVQTDRALIAAASEVVVLADHSKFMRNGAVRVAPIERVMTVVTDEDLPDSTRRALEKQNIRVFLA
jgi:DeoR family transcriptional regulator of aga operon